MNNQNTGEDITLKHLKNEMDAELLVDHLQAVGVFALIKKDDPAAMGLIRGASVIIRKEDEEKALDLLRDLGF